MLLRNNFFSQIIFFYVAIITKWISAPDSTDGVAWFIEKGSLQTGISWVCVGFAAENHLFFLTAGWGAQTPRVSLAGIHQTPTKIWKKPKNHFLVPHMFTNMQGSKAIFFLISFLQHIQAAVFPVVPPVWFLKNSAKFRQLLRKNGSCKGSPVLLFHTVGLCLPLLLWSCTLPTHVLVTRGIVLLWTLCC